MTGFIEDYALISDLETAALVGRDGSIDWLCLPRFDSPACFAALLGTEDNGYWRLAPVGQGECLRRAYREETLVLDTFWEDPSGTVRVTDFMPPRAELPYIVRIVHGVSGTVAMRGELKLRFHQGRVVPWMHPDSTCTVAVAGPDSAWLTADRRVRMHTTDRSTQFDFTVREGESLAFLLLWSPSHLPDPQWTEPMVALRETMAFWQDWVSACCYEGPWRDAVVRSLITLKALTYAPTGGIVAAATTSLPECVGGERNWDYRYCWLRDSTLTLSCLLRSGFRTEALAWRDWLLRAVAGSSSGVQALYGLAGQRRCQEVTAPWLAGYEGSRPVRFGNAAVSQFQLDVHGEVLDTLYQSLCAGVPLERHAWNLVRQLMAQVEAHWRDPDEGLWEVRGPRRQFVHSKVMCWVAADRAMRMARAGGLYDETARWRSLREEVHREVCEAGWDPSLGAFTQFYGAKTLDASALLMPQVGFLPADDWRVRSTVEAMAALDDHGFLRRYAQAPTGVHQVDGLRGREGSFVACSLWLADALTFAGRLGEAREIFERVLAVRSDVGLLSEQWDPVAGRQLGNMPQAFSHIALVNTAFNLQEAAAR